MNLFDVCSSELVVARASATVIEVANLMRTRHVGCVVVLGDEEPRRPVGIVTDRDIVIRVVACADRLSFSSIDQVMSRNLVYASGGTGLTEAVELMRDRGVRRLLVMGEHGEPKGIVSFDDLLLAMTQSMGTMAQSIVSGLLREEQSPYAP